MRGFFYITRNNTLLTYTHTYRAKAYINKYYITKIFRCTPVLYTVN